MFPSERQAEIMIQLNEHGSIKSLEIANYLQTSLVTIRRDLEEMQEKGLLKRVHGGAVAMTEKRLEHDAYFNSRINFNHEKKRSIGAAGAELIREGETVYFDIGTTVLEIARAIRDRKNLTVLTSSLPVLNELMDTEVRVFGVGGRLRPKERAFTGIDASDVLKKFCIDKAFIGAGGVSIANGITDYNYDSAILRRQAILRARDSILVADSSKFGSDVFAVVCDLKKIGTIITDRALPSEIRKELSEKNWKLILVD